MTPETYAVKGMPAYTTRYRRSASGCGKAVRNGLGDPAGTCIDPRTQVVDGKTVCLVSCQRSPEPVYLRWKGMEKAAAGDLYVRTGPGTVRLGDEDAATYVASRFGTS